MPNQRTIGEIASVAVVLASTVAYAGTPVAQLPYTAAMRLSSSYPLGRTHTVMFDSVRSLPDSCDAATLRLCFDMEVSRGDNRSVRLLRQGATSIQLLTEDDEGASSRTFQMEDVDIREGIHRYELPFCMSSVSRRPSGPERISGMTFAITKIPADTDAFVFSIDNVTVEARSDTTWLPTLFSDHMMFQQGRPIRIWGFTTPGTEVGVVMRREDGEGEILAGIGESDPTGRWSVTLPPLDAGYAPYLFEVIEHGTVTHRVSDILIGEVWVSGGQSNMRLPVRATQQREEMMEQASDNSIRFFYTPEYPWSGAREGDMPALPLDDIYGGHWGCGDNGAQCGAVSAVAYIAASDLRERLDVPVGFLHTATGGTNIESWVLREEVEKDPELLSELTETGFYSPVESWNNKYTSVSALCNQKIAPLRGYSVAGALWYQGENNVGRPESYAAGMLALKRSWEDIFGFGEDEMPFIFCQTGRWYIEPYRPQHIAWLDEAMYDAWCMGENMALLPIYDTNMDYSWNTMIHPTDKFPVGHRFGTSAYNFVYGGEGRAYTAPVPVEYIPGDRCIKVRFEHAGDGLVTTDGSQEVRGFAIAGKKGIYYNATACISGPDEVTVWNENVDAPVNVSYAFSSNNFYSNLSSSEGIAAAPFRSERGASSHYYSPQDWTYADGPTYWAISSSSVAGPVSAWLGNDVEICYETELKTQGLASMCVLYGDPETAEFRPNMEPIGVQPYFSRFSILSADIFNPELRRKFIVMGVRSTDGSEAVSMPEPVEISLEWQRVEFRMPEDADMSHVGGLFFRVIDEGPGIIYADNFLFGEERQIEEPIGEVPEVAVEETDSRWFDLMGREVAEPSEPGVYIRNGRKIIKGRF